MSLGIHTHRERVGGLPEPSPPFIAHHRFRHRAFISFEVSESASGTGAWSTHIIRRHFRNACGPCGYAFRVLSQYSDRMSSSVFSFVVVSLFRVAPAPLVISLRHQADIPQYGASAMRDADGTMSTTTFLSPNTVVIPHRVVHRCRPHPPPSFLPLEESWPLCFARSRAHF